MMAVRTVCGVLMRLWVGCSLGSTNGRYDARHTDLLLHWLSLTKRLVAVRTRMTAIDVQNWRRFFRYRFRSSTVLSFIFLYSLDPSVWALSHTGSGCYFVVWAFYLFVALCCTSMCCSLLEYMLCYFFLLLPAGRFKTHNVADRRRLSPLTLNPEQ